MDYTTYWPTIAALFLGLLMIVVGYTLRSRNSGVVILWLGQALIVALVLFHILEAVAGG